MFILRAVGGFLLLNIFSFINKWIEPVKHFVKREDSILRDEKGVLEPHSDLIATALAVIGFVVLAALLSKAYMGYEDRSFALENYESASLLAGTVAEASVLKAENPGVLSASALDRLSCPEGLMKERHFLQHFQEITHFWSRSGQKTGSGIGL